MSAQSTSEAAPGRLLLERWQSGIPQIGIFTRLTTPEPYELVSLAGLDAVVLDAEHGSFDRSTLSRCVLAAKAGGLATLVRMTDAGLPAIQHAIGAGVDGIIVPHADRDEIAAVAAFVRGPAVQRAHAGATRAAQFREAAWDRFAAEAARLIVLAQIDDPAGILAAASIAAVNGLDGAFLGRISLTLAWEGDCERADAALEQVCNVFRERLIGISLTDQALAPIWRARGVGLFVIDSDQRLLLTAARSRATAFRHILGDK